MSRVSERAATLLAFCAAVVIAGAFFFVGARISHNEQAIERSCEVLAFAIAHSQPVPDRRGPTPQQLLRQEILEGMSHAERTAFLASVRSYPPLGPPDCGIAKGEGDPFEARPGR